MGHSRDFSTDGYCRKKKKFINWVNEVEHDYYGAMIMADTNRDALLRSIDYKISAKGEIRFSKSVNNDDIFHPSWNRRKHYVETYKDFDMPLIREIAKDAGCNDEKLIQRIYDNYEPIKLK